MGRQRKYFTEEERKAAKREHNNQWYQNNKEELSQYRQEHKDEIAEYKKQWYQNNKEEIDEQRKQYRKTKKGRAVYLVGHYKSADKKYNRGECTLTVEWIVENVFSGQCCHYCGESDWKKLGCDRLDNSLPHTPENCVPCCAECNSKKARRTYDEYMRLIGKVG